jgi:phosphoribosyl-ATP pyrophosphohydrolase/phosphoribosyl-AMP cyclohydrolase
MVGYVNDEAMERTAETGEVHFWSRSRRELWRKGATSGNTFRLVGAEVDCDADAVLFRVRPAGPACHEGKTSCFDPPEPAAAGTPEIGLTPSALWTVVEQRARDLPEGSYTARLVAGGVDAIGRKLVEEATEVLLAARDHLAGADAEQVYEEAADLVYHLLVLLAERGLRPGGVARVLAGRASKW